MDHLLSNFRCTKEEIEGLLVILMDEWDYNSFSEDRDYFITGSKKYLENYGEYCQFQASPDGSYLTELKERYPMFSYATGEIVKPIPRKLVIVHMLEIPFKEVPLYVTSEEQMVRKLAAWRLHRGH